MTRKSAPHGNRRLPSVDRTLEDHPELVWGILVTHEELHLCKPLAMPSGAGTSVKSRRPRVKKKTCQCRGVSVESRLPSPAYPASRKHFPCPGSHQRKRYPRGDSGAKARCEATASSRRRARWKPQQLDGNSGHVPSKKSPRCHAFQKSQSP